MKNKKIDNRPHWDDPDLKCYRYGDRPISAEHNQRLSKLVMNGGFSTQPYWFDDLTYDMKIKKNHDKSVLI